MGHSEIYVKALQKCKDVNEQLNSQPWWDDQQGFVASKIVESAPIRLKRPRLYDASWVESLVEREKQKVKDKQASKPEWLQKVTSFADGIVKIAVKIKPIVDIFIPQSPEYSIPYACLWIIFKVSLVARSRAEALVIQTSLS